MYPGYSDSTWSTQPPPSCQYLTDPDSSRWASSFQPRYLPAASYTEEEEQPPPLPPRPRQAYLGMRSSQTSQQSGIPLQTFSSNTAGRSISRTSGYTKDTRGMPLPTFGDRTTYSSPPMMSYQPPAHSGMSSQTAHNVRKTPYNSHRCSHTSSGISGQDTRVLVGSTATAGILGGMTGGIALSGAEGADEGDDEGNGEGNPLRNLNLDPGYNPGLNTYTPGGGAGGGVSDGGSDCCEGDWCGDGDGCCCCCGDCGDCSGCGGGGGCF